MEALTRRWEIPLALYGDHHGVFQFSGPGTGRKNRWLNPHLSTPSDIFPGHLRLDLFAGR